MENKKKMEFFSILLKKGLVLDWHYIAEKSLDRGIKKEQVEKIADSINNK